MDDNVTNHLPVHEPMDLSIAWQYLGSAVEPYHDLLQPAFGYVRLAANECLLRQGERGDTLYIVLTGRLRVVDENSRGEEQFLTFKEPGEGVGEISLLTSERRTASVFAEVETRLYSLSRQALDEIAKQSAEAGDAINRALKQHIHQSRLNHVLILTSIFKDLSEEVLQDLQAELELITVASGEVVMKSDEEADALYIIIGGRLRVVSKSSKGGQAYTVDSRRGQTVGEIGLITGEKRSATVFAVRDSLLARLSQASFRKLVQKHPEAILSQFAAPIIARLRSQVAGAILKTSAVTTITVTAVDHTVPLKDFTEKLSKALGQLGATKRLDSDACEAQLGTANVAYLADTDPKNERFVFWLNEQEATHEYVVYEADYELTSWTERCIRQADMVLIVGQAHASPQLSDIELRLKRDAITLQKIQCLILLHSKETHAPGQTSDWLANRTVRAHYHIRLGETADYERIGRMITGHGVGVVLSGGGARALAHIGVIRALEESGITIDAIGAVSGGAIVAGLWAMGLHHDDIVQKSRQATDRIDYTFPLHALTSGRNWTNAMRNLFGDVCIEDLWRRFFCISTNLSQAKLHSHESGSLMHAVRASTAIPGILPPVFHEGVVLVDGGIINNLPADLMRAHPDIGQVIAIDVGMADSSAMVKPFDYAISGWKSLWSRLSPWANRPTAPAISDVLLRSISITNTQSAKATKHLVDLFLKPPVQTFGLMDFDKIEALAEIGYDYACKEISKWQNERLEK